MIWQRHPRARPSILSLLLACALPAHPQTSSADTLYRIHGRVINGASNQPLARALVTSGDRRLAVMTGSEGQFSIDVNIPPQPVSAGSPRRLGFYTNLLSLVAQKPGYIASLSPEAFPLDDTLPSRDIVLKLMPASVISGHVSATTEAAVPNLRVQLLIHQTNDGELIWRQASSQNTNSRGEFHFTNLRPGEYTVMSAQWRGNQPLPPRQQPNTVTQQYPAVFFGDNPTLNSAAKFRLAYGDSVQADLHLHPASFYPVTIPLAATSSGSVSARLGTGQIFTGYALGYNPRSGAVESSLPSGNYDVTLIGPGNSPTSALLSIHVAGAPLQTAPVTLAPPTTIEVQVHEDFTQPQSSQNATFVQSGGLTQSGVRGQEQQNFPPVHITLRSADSGNGYAAVSTPKPGRTDQLTVDNVLPGPYLVRADPQRGYVASLSAAGIDLTEKPLVVTAGGSVPPLEVTLRDDFANLTGTVNPGSDTAPQTSFIVFLPADAKARYNQAFAGPNGKFAISIPPGNYRVMAFKGQPPQFPYRDLEAMRRYEGKGVTVIAAAGETLQIEVPLLDAAALEVP